MLREFRAVVEDVRERERRAGQAVWQLALSETDFLQGDRGVLVATARSGARLTVEVVSVEVDASGTVWHTVSKPLGTGVEVAAQVERS